MRTGSQTGQYQLADLSEDLFWFGFYMCQFVLCESKYWVVNAGFDEFDALAEERKFSKG